MKKRILIPLIIICSLVTLTGIGALACFIMHPNKYNNYCNFYYSLRTTYFDIDNLFAKKGETVFFGDSITEFCNLNKYYKNTKNYNRGISGDTSDGLLGRMNSSIFALNPKQIVLLVGINDLTRHINISQISENVSNICNQIKEKLPETKLILQGVYPYLKEYSSSIKSLNESYNLISINYGYQYIDFYSLLSVNDALNKEYTNDGLHLNDKGYEVVSSKINELLIV